MDTTSTYWWYLILICSIPVAHAQIIIPRELRVQHALSGMEWDEFIEAIMAKLGIGTIEEPEPEPEPEMSPHLSAFLNSNSSLMNSLRNGSLRATLPDLAQLEGLPPLQPLPTPSTSTPKSTTPTTRTASSKIISKTTFPISSTSILTSTVRPSRTPNAPSSPFLKAKSTIMPQTIPSTSVTQTTRAMSTRLHVVTIKNNAPETLLSQNTVPNSIKVKLQEIMRPAVPKPDSVVQQKGTSQIRQPIPKTIRTPHPDLFAPPLDRLTLGRPQLRQKPNQISESHIRLHQKAPNDSNEFRRQQLTRSPYLNQPISQAGPLGRALTQGPQLRHPTTRKPTPRPVTLDKDLMQITSLLQLLSIQFPKLSILIDRLPELLSPTSTTIAATTTTTTEVTTTKQSPAPLPNSGLRLLIIQAPPLMLPPTQHMGLRQAEPIVPLYQERLPTGQRLENHQNPKVQPGHVRSNLNRPLHSAKSETQIIHPATTHAVLNPRQKVWGSHIIHPKTVKPPWMMQPSNVYAPEVRSPPRQLPFFDNKLNPTEHILPSILPSDDQGKHTKKQKFGLASLKNQSTNRKQSVGHPMHIAKPGQSYTQFHVMRQEERGTLGFKQISKPVNTLQQRTEQPDQRQPEIKLSNQLSNFGLRRPIVQAPPLRQSSMRNTRLKQVTTRLPHFQGKQPGQLQENRQIPMIDNGQYVTQSYRATGGRNRPVTQTQSPATRPSPLPPPPITTLPRSSISRKLFKSHVRGPVYHGSLTFHLPDGNLEPFDTVTAKTAKTTLNHLNSKGNVKAIQNPNRILQKTTKREPVDRLQERRQQKLNLFSPGKTHDFSPQTQIQKQRIRNNTYSMKPAQSPVITGNTRLQHGRNVFGELNVSPVLNTYSSGVAESALKPSLSQPKTISTAEKLSNVNPTGRKFAPSQENRNNSGVTNEQKTFPKSRRLKPKVKHFFVLMNNKLQNISQLVPSQKLLEGTQNLINKTTTTLNRTKDKLGGLSKVFSNKADVTLSKAEGLSEIKRTNTTVNNTSGKNDMSKTGSTKETRINIKELTSPENELSVVHISTTAVRVATRHLPETTTSEPKKQISAMNVTTRTIGSDNEVHDASSVVTTPYIPNTSELPKTSSVDRSSNIPKTYDVPKMLDISKTSNVPEIFSISKTSAVLKISSITTTSSILKTSSVPKGTSILTTGSPGKVTKEPTQQSNSVLGSSSFKIQVKTPPKYSLYKGPRVEQVVMPDTTTVSLTSETNGLRNVSPPKHAKSHGRSPKSENTIHIRFTPNGQAKIISRQRRLAVSNVRGSKTAPLKDVIMPAAALAAPLRQSTQFTPANLGMPSWEWSASSRGTLTWDWNNNWFVIWACSVHLLFLKH